MHTKLTVTKITLPGARSIYQVKSSFVTRISLMNAEPRRHARFQVPLAFLTLSTHQRSRSLDRIVHVSPLLNQSSQHQSS